MLHWWKVSDSNTGQPLLFTINVEHEAGKKYRFSSLRHYPTGNRTKIATFSCAYSTHLGRKLDRWGFCLEYLEDFLVVMKARRKIGCRSVSQRLAAAKDISVLL